MIAFDPYDENRDTGAFILIDRLDQRDDRRGPDPLRAAARRRTSTGRRSRSTRPRTRCSRDSSRPCCGSPAFPAPASRRSPTWSRSSCTRSASTPTCSTATTCATASTATSASPTPTASRTSAASPRSSKLMVEAGLIVMVSFISPFRAERRMARALFGEGEFLEVHVDTPLDEAERRDVKGLYKKARRGRAQALHGHRFAVRGARAPRDLRRHDAEQCRAIGCHDRRAAARERSTRPGILTAGSGPRTGPAGFHWAAWRQNDAHPGRPDDQKTRSAPCRLSFGFTARRAGARSFAPRRCTSSARGLRCRSRR